MVARLKLTASIECTGISEDYPLSGVGHVTVHENEGETKGGPKVVGSNPVTNS